MSRMSRFDYVAYDERASALQKDFKELAQLAEVRLNTAFADTEAGVEGLPGHPKNLALGSRARAKQKAIDALEEFYMWCGKAVRDDQLARNGSAPLQEGRVNS